ncbi:MAG: DUF445 family protein [Anaerotignum sp.]|nr:DUF445 family protein [Anaerotignum sp.]MBR6541835.1 DUF445 family protein [Anaerotignum sp.]
MTLQNLAGPIIGSIIGYCTNYIAVKMLFYPRNEVKVCGHKVPFTPGAIPKGKPRLAKTVGNVVANTLLTEEDIKQRILSPETEEAVIDKVITELSNKIYVEMGRICKNYEEYGELKENLSNAFTDQIMDSIGKIDLKNTIVNEAGRVIKEKVNGTMLAMFLSDEMLNSFIQPVGVELEAYIAENGKDFIQKEVNEKIMTFEQKSILDLCNEMNVEESKIRDAIRSIYRNASEDAVVSVLKNVDISTMIEGKINDMKTEDLERMVLTVMKKELDTIVNLGALIGFILGSLNTVL